MDGLLLFVKRLILLVLLHRRMGAGRQTKRSCPFCQHDDRDILESEVLDGLVTLKDMDKNMGWRTNTSDRHMKNHVGDFDTSSNHRCLVCTSDHRVEYEIKYFEEGASCQEIAEELDCPEPAVYRHMKNHLQPLVKQSAAPLVAVKVGHEIDTLRQNVEGLNGKLSTLMSETSIHDDGAVSDLVKLHKEVRETLKDLVRYQEKWAEPEEKMVANTINILKVEMSKESPETWKRVKQALMEHSEDGDIIVE